MVIVHDTRGFSGQKIIVLGSVLQDRFQQYRAPGPFRASGFKKMATVLCSGPFLSIGIRKKINGIVIRGILERQK